MFLIKNEGISVVAVDEDEVVGTCLGSFDGRKGYIQKLVLKKEFRNNGAGKRLVDQVLDNLR